MSFPFLFQKVPFAGVGVPDLGEGLVENSNKTENMPNFPGTLRTEKFGQQFSDKNFRTRF